MSTKNSLDAGTESLAELFHLVRSLVPQDQRLFTASPDMTVAEAIQVMRQHNFSQLPVVAGDTVLGVFSFRSLASGLLKIEGGTDQLGDLPVDEFVEHFRFVQPSDNWESTLEYLDSDDGVLVGRRDRLEAIVTSMDVLTYLHEIASPFVILAEIELSLRRIILACVAEEQLQQCIEVSLASKYEKGQAPTRLSDMTFNDYVQIIDHGRNWPHFTAAFGAGKGQRKRTANRLREVRVLRNEIFHFRQQLEPNDLKALTAHRDWLQMKAVAFDARRRRKITAPKKEEKTKAPKTQEPTRRKWDESSFLEHLGDQRGVEEVAAAKQIFDWSRGKGLVLRWGKGKAVGTCYVSLKNQSAHSPFGLWSNGYIELHLGYLKRFPPFDSAQKRSEWLGRLNAISGISVTDTETDKFPYLPLDALTNQVVLQRFLETVDWVLAEIERASAGGLGELVPPRVATALDPSAVERLHRFLDSLPIIGIRPEKATASIPYKAVLRYHPPTWEEPKPHSVTVFYLTSGQSPKLAFNTGSLVNVPGLDIEQLTDRLLEAGCSQTSTLKSIPLVLKERNDQATFDRLYDILEDLMRKHQVA